MKYLTLTDIYGSPVDSKLIHDGELNVDALISAVTYAIAEKWQIKLTDTGEDKGTIPAYKPVLKKEDIPNLIEELKQLPCLTPFEVNEIIYGNKHAIKIVSIPEIETPTIEDTFADLISDLKDNVNKQQVKRNKKKK